METSKSHNRKQVPKRPKNRLTEDQLRLLEASFDQAKKLEPERKHQLASQLGMPARQVAIWYQNKRARWKTQNIELDYRTLQLRLESVVKTNMKLLKEVTRLRDQFQNAHGALNQVLAVDFGATPVSSISSSSDDGTWSFPVDMNCHWQNTGGFQKEDIYGYLAAKDNNYSLFSPSWISDEDPDKLSD